MKKKIIFLLVFIIVAILALIDFGYQPEEKLLDIEYHDTGEKAYESFQLDLS